LALILGGVCVLLVTKAMVKNTIIEKHTRFLFAQIDKELMDNVKNFLLTSHTNANWNEFNSQQYGILADAIRESKTLDWNSCSLNENIIIDGWSHMCIVEYRTIPTPTIRFSSCGKDGIKGTNDDIILKIEIKKK